MYPWAVRCEPSPYVSLNDAGVAQVFGPLHCECAGTCHTFPTLKRSNRVGFLHRPPCTSASDVHPGWCGRTMDVDDDGTTPAVGGCGDDRAHALLVCSNDNLRIRISDVLRHHGFDVMVATTFKNAVGQVRANPPAVLVTELRLQEYNGLHVVVTAHSIHRDIAAAVLIARSDVVLEREIRALGAEPICIDAEEHLELDLLRRFLLALPCRNEIH